MGNVEICARRIHKSSLKTWCKRSVEAENPTKNLREWNITAERQKLLDGAGKHHINCSTDKSVLRYKTKIEGDPTTELQSLDLRDIELTVSDKRYHFHIREGVNFSKNFFLNKGGLPSLKDLSDHRNRLHEASNYSSFAY